MQWRSDDEDDKDKGDLMMKMRSESSRGQTLATTQAEFPAIMTPPLLQSTGKAASDALDESHNWSDRLLLVKLDLPQRDF